MDPLSIIASSVTLATAIQSTLSAIRHIWGAKSVLCALENEISDLEVILNEIDQMVRADKSVGTNTTLVGLCHTIETKLKQLEGDIEECKRPLTPGWRIEHFRRLRKRIHFTAKEYQEEFRDIRSQLTAVLSALSASGSSRIHLDLQEICILLSRREDDEKPLGARLCDSEADTVYSVETSVNDGGGLDEESEIPIPETSILSIKTLETPPAGRTDDVSLPPFNYLDGPGNSTEQALAFKVSQFARAQCREGCSCACHKSRRMGTPQLIKSCIGSLFLGYSGLPGLQEKCDQHFCLARSRPLVCLTYIFPRWFLERAVSCMLTVLPVTGPVASLKVQRTVRGDADVFRYSKAGDVDKLMDLFRNGLASPNDVHYQTGASPLQFALSLLQVNACKFLLQAGADPHLCDHLNESAASKAWAKTLSNRLGPDDEEALRTMFSQSDASEGRELSVLHKVVLGLVKKPLELELQASTAEIDKVDAYGRTPISFAAERGDAQAVATLLRFGANPIIPRSSGSPPLKYAAVARDPACIRLLLEAGVDVGTKTKWGQTPLHFAAAQTKDSRHAKILIEAGADVNLRDSDFQTPLTWTVISNNPDVAAILLEKGARIQMPEYPATDPLILSINVNRHRLLEMFTQYPICTDVPLQRGQTILHVIAAASDIESMQILAKLDFSNLFPDQVDDSGLTAMQIISQRNDSTPELVAAFSKLLCGLKQQGDESDDDNATEKWYDSIQTLDQTD